MAKYTELFSEYLESGGELPTAFDQIDGFKDLFVGHFIDKEIGFETEVLFAIKLETKANIVIPVYAERITALENAISKLVNPQKVRKTVVDGGEQNSQTWALPFNSQDADPNAKAHSDAIHNEDEVTESGLTPDEAIRMVEKMEGQIYLIKDALLNEFDSLFMKVY